MPNCKILHSASHSEGCILLLFVARERFLIRAIGEVYDASGDFVEIGNLPQFNGSAFRTTHRSCSLGGGYSISIHEALVQWSNASHAKVATQCEDMYSSDTDASSPGAMSRSARVSIPVARSTSSTSSPLLPMRCKSGAKRITDYATDNPSP